MRRTLDGPWDSLLAEKEKIILAIYTTLWYKLSTTLNQLGSLIDRKKIRRWGKRWMLIWTEAPATIEPTEGTIEGQKKFKVISGSSDNPSRPIYLPVNLLYD